MKPKAPPVKDEAKMDLLKQKEMSVQQASQLLGISRQAIYNMMLRGDLQQSSRKSVLYGAKVSTDSIVAFMRKHNMQIPTNKKHSS